VCVCVCACVVCLRLQALSWATVLGVGISLAGHGAAAASAAGPLGLLGVLQQRAAWAAGVVCLALANSYAGWLVRTRCLGYLCVCVRVLARRLAPVGRLHIEWLAAVCASTFRRSDPPPYWG
jgi:hypothetical protein